MFSETEYQYLENLVNTYILNNEYNYYLAYTNTDLSSSYTNDYYDFYVIFSKEEINFTNNRFELPKENIRIGINAKSANRNGTNASRYVFTENVGGVSINQYEFIYTNALNSRYANILSKNEYIVNHDLSYNIDKNEYYSTPFLISILIIMIFLKWCFPMKGGKKV